MFGSRSCTSGPEAVSYFRTHAVSLRALALPRPLWRVATVNKGFTVPSEQLAQLGQIDNQATSRHQKPLQSEGAESSGNSSETSLTPIPIRGKRKATAALSDDSNSESTLMGSDEEEENDSIIPFTKVTKNGRKNTNKTRRHPSKANHISSESDMEVDTKKTLSRNLNKEPNLLAKQLTVQTLLRLVHRQPK
ncbi:hypothetical protein EVAR_80985_1 [Eumeta japonica]|uniref:Uncharacterized protein n=1 Tax=Eumeta variegata TaxID=151549 RepID=A0A4C1WPU6_EUMVA|nr:hypothetical protein EVAR_80985_1 [Eumeta japonica]